MGIKNQTNFSKNLIRYRKEKNLTQEELANLSGLTRRKIGYYEKEANKPPIDNIEAIAKALNVTISDLIGTNETAEIQNDLSKLDTRTLKKIKMILSLPKIERHMIYSMAESFIEKRKKRKKKKRKSKHLTESKN